MKFLPPFNSPCARHQPLGPLINSGLEDNSILIPASSQGYCVLISKSWRVWAEHYKDRAGIQISFLRLKQQPIGLGWAQDCRFLAGYKNTIKIIGCQGGLQTNHTTHVSYNKTGESKNDCLQNQTFTNPRFSSITLATIT